MSYRGFGQFGAAGTPPTFNDPVAGGVILPSYDPTMGWFVLDNEGNEWQWNASLSIWTTVSSGGAVSGGTLPIGATTTGAAGATVVLPVSTAATATTAAPTAASTSPAATSSAAAATGTTVPAGTVSAAPAKSKAGTWLLIGGAVLGVVLLARRKSSPAAAAPVQ
jgi:hypothetical protein